MRYLLVRYWLLRYLRLNANESELDNEDMENGYKVNINMKVVMDRQIFNLI